MCYHADPTSASDGDYHIELVNDAGEEVGRSGYLSDDYATRADAEAAIVGSPEGWYRVKYHGYGDEPVAAPPTVPSTGPYGIRMRYDRADLSAVFEDTHYDTRGDAEAAIAGAIDPSLYVVAWLGAGDEPVAPAADTHTEFSIVISPIETITASLTVRDGGVDGHYTNSRYPNDPLDRRHNGVTLDEAKAAVLAQSEQYRAAVEMYDRIEALVGSLGR